MKVKVTDNFYDVTENLKLRERGEILEVDKERATHLLMHHLATPIPAPAAETKPAKQNK